MEDSLCDLLSGATYCPAITVVSLENKLVQGSHSHEKSWKMKIGFPGLEKLWKIDKWGKVMEKSWNLRFP